MKILPLCQLWASLLFLLHSCSNPHVDRVLSSAEQLMDSGFPDSAWIYLNSLRPEEIREARLRARLSLDRAMALDKSYVDTSDIAILAPVISFYKWPFHQKKRYLTAYYQGRILENGKKDEEAIKALTRAGNLAGRSGDSLYMVRICSAKARIYLRNYALRQAEEATDEGLRWCAPHSPNWSVLMLDKTEHLLARKQYEQVDHVLISLPPSSPRWFEAAVHLCRACPEYRKDYEDIFRHNGSLLKSIHPRVQAEYFLMEGEPSRALEMLREEMPKWQTVMFRRHINLLFFRTGIVVHCRFQPRGPLCGGKVSAMGTRAEASASQDTLSTCVVAVSCLVFWGIRYRLRGKAWERKLDDLRTEYDSLLRWRSQLEEKNRQIGAVLDIRIRALAPFFSQELPVVLDRSPELDRLLTERKEILSNISLLFALYHSAFSQELEGFGLDYMEVGFCCLYALGLRVNEIPEVIGRDAYHVNPHIRRKIGLDVHDTNLPNWIRDLYAQKG